MENRLCIVKRLIIDKLEELRAVALRAGNISQEIESLVAEKDELIKSNTIGEGE